MTQDNQRFLKLCAEFEKPVFEKLKENREDLASHNWSKLVDDGQSLNNLSNVVMGFEQEINELSQEIQELKQFWHGWIFHCGQAGGNFAQGATSMINNNPTQGNITINVGTEHDTAGQTDHGNFDTTVAGIANSLGVPIPAGLDPSEFLPAVLPAIIGAFA